MKEMDKPNFQSIGFGIEALGIRVLQNPRLFALILTVFSLLCAFGLTRLNSDNSFEALFRSQSPVYLDYDKFRKDFPVSQRDILVVVSSKKTPDRDWLEMIRDLHFELQLAELADDVISAFTVTEDVAKDGYAAPLFPEILPQNKKIQKLLDRAMKNTIISKRLMTPFGEQGMAFLLLVNLNEQAASKEHVRHSIDQIRTTISDITGQSDARFVLLGTPIMEEEIRAAGARDRIRFNILGFLVGLIISYTFFRHLGFVFIIAICPLAAILWTLGCMGLWGLQLNYFSNTIIPLAMVLAFSDSMHMVFAIRRQLISGETLNHAIRHGVLTVGPACALTSMTTALALLSLTVADSEIVRAFSYSAAISTVFAFLAVIMIVPLLSIFLFRSQIISQSVGSKSHLQNSFSIWLDEIFVRFAAWIPGQSKAINMVGFVLFVTLALLYAQLETKYRMGDQVPDRFKEILDRTTQQTDLALSNPIQIEINVPPALKLTSDTALSAVGQIHEAMQKVSNVLSVSSLFLFERKYATNLTSTDGSFEKFIERMPDNMKNRYLNEKKNILLVTVTLPDLRTDQMEHVLRDIEQEIFAYKRRYNNFDFKVTGIPVLVTRQSTEIVSQLNTGLLIAIAVVTILIGLAFRSFSVFLLAILPNVFPIAAAGSLLYVFGYGIDFAAIIALTVAFGLAVDDTIHFLNRLRVEELRTDEITIAISRTLSEVGPVLVLTTMVLTLGLGVTVFGELLPSRTFGQLCLITLLAALIADLIILPALVMVKRHIRSALKNEK